MKNCETCNHWCAVPYLSKEANPERGYGLGQCRRHPPRILASQQELERYLNSEFSDAIDIDDAAWMNAAWPVTCNTEWCGEWREREASEEGAGD